MQKLWIATELFYPEETSTSFILTKIANKLTEKYAVEVVCGEPVYDKNKKSESFTLNPAISIHRIKGLKSDKNRLVDRSIQFYFLSFALFFYLLKNVKKEEKVFIVTNPAPLILLISILKSLKKIKVVILVHDVFPENTIPAGIFKSTDSWVYKILKRKFDRSYAKADELIVLGRDMQEIVASKTKNFKNPPHITVIENWGDTENIYPLLKDEAFKSNSVFKDKIIFQYAGNMGRVQGLLDLLKIIGQINNDQLAFYFVGEGAVKEEMINYVNSFKISNVYFGNAYSRDEQISVLNQADCAFVSLAQGMYGLGVPSKTYNILAAGKPILYIGEENSEINLLVKENNIGYTFQKEEELIAFFNNFNQESLRDLNIKKINARKVAVDFFSEQLILNKFFKAI